MQERTTKMVIIGCVVVITLVGYALGRQHVPDPILDTEVRSQGLFGQETSRIISTAVTNLRAEEKIIVYSFTGSADVVVTRARVLGLLKGEQWLSVPATVTYHLDMANFGPEHVRLDPTSRTLLVQLPDLAMGDVAMRPEQARVVNRGVLSLWDDTVQELLKQNYRKARAAFIAQAQQEEIVGLARRNAQAAIERQFELPLRAAGLTDIQVRAYFPSLARANRAEVPQLAEADAVPMSLLDAHHGLTTEPA